MVSEVTSARVCELISAVACPNAKELMANYPESVSIRETRGEDLADELCDPTYT